jgi:hypothetical protein
LLQYGTLEHTSPVSSAVQNCYSRLGLGEKFTNEFYVAERPHEGVDEGVHEGVHDHVENSTKSTYVGLVTKSTVTAYTVSCCLDTVFKLSNLIRSMTR